MSGMNIDLSLEEIISKGGSRILNSKKYASRRRFQGGRFARFRNRTGPPLRPLLSAPPDKITVSNLAKSVTQDDIGTLFERIGKLKSVQLIFDSSGKSKGTAFVIFANPSDAQKAVKEYHNRPFDGQPMKLELIYKVNRDDYISLSANNKGSSGGKFRRNPSSFGIGRRGNRRRRKAPLKTQEDLNAEMDDYMKGKNTDSMDVIQDQASLESGMQNIAHQSTGGINLVLTNALAD